MLKRMFALSNQGLRDLNKGIAATTLSNLCLIAPVSLLVMVIWELLNVISGQESSMRDHAALFICGTVVMFIIVFLTQWLQYNKTYTVAYKESANRRIVLAEKLRKLPLSFFGQRDLSDLTTTIMGDCTALERVFSNAIPQLFGTIFMFIITAIGLLVLDWRMGLCIVVPVPVAALVVFAAKKAQSNAESANMDAKRAAYQTNIGENGSALSGGERQRISIARALLKNAPIVLLDEATASMDAESETLIQDALSVLLKDKTVMVIAHRMRTVANADKIVVLDDGKVSEMGTPAELMKKGGLYAHLVELQQGK